MKKVQKVAVIFLAVILVIIAGCSSAKPPKEALQSAMLKIGQANSYSIKMTLGLNELEIPPSITEQSSAAQTAAMAGLLKDATITVDAIYQKNPMRTDMNMEIVLPGDMEMKLKIPMIMTEDTLYVKVPEIPMLPLPGTITGKYIKIDLKELAAQQGSSDINLEAQQKLGKDLGQVLLKHFDEKTYFSDIKAADAGLPADLKADQVIVFEINEGNYAKTVETVINKVIPEIIDVLLKNEDSLKAMQLGKSDVEKWKTELDMNKAEMLKTLQNDVKIMTLKITGAISDGYLVYQDSKVNVEATDKDSGQKMKLGLDVNAIYSDINKKMEFPEIPSDAITLDEIMKQFQLPAGL